MSLSEEQEQRLANILEACEDARHRLSDWEADFLDDQVNRYAQYKSQTSLSPKQWGVLERMMDKVTNG